VPLSAWLLILFALLPSNSTSAAKRGCDLRPMRLSAARCRVIDSDSSARRNPTRLWGRIDCTSRDRVNRRVAASGPGRAATRNGKYRQLRVIDGDNIYGERCELGLNDWQAKTFAKFRQGQRRVTFASLRFSKHFPLYKRMWQTVLQMKQTEPSLSSNRGPVLEVQAWQGRLRLIHNWHQLWSTKIRKNRWIRIALVVRYSQSHRGGSVRMYVDRNGDGDARDKHERSRRFHVRTLMRELPGETIRGLPPGASIPSHLRVGIYHDPRYRCPPPEGCSIDVDNVKVLALPRR
jgi:Polysaccharide lyase